jgi:hypothetical protein
MSDVVKQLKTKLYECTPASRAFQTRPTGSPKSFVRATQVWDEVISWDDIDLKYPDDDKTDHNGKDLAVRLANLEHDFNKLCYNSLVYHKDWSQGSLNRKALDLYQKGHKVLALRHWTNYLVCAECGTQKDEVIICCDYCCKGWHENCRKHRAVGKLVTHPLRYEGRKEDSCWFCSGHCLNEFENLMAAIKPNLPASERSGFCNLKQDMRTFSGNHDAFRIVLAAHDEQQLLPGIVVERINMTDAQAKAVDEAASHPKPILVMWGKAGYDSLPSNLKDLAYWDVSTDLVEVEMYSYDQALRLANQRCPGGQMSPADRIEFEQYFNGAHLLQEFFLEATDESASATDADRTIPCSRKRPSRLHDDPGRRATAGAPLKRGGAQDGGAQALATKRRKQPAQRRKVRPLSVPPHATPREIGRPRLRPAASRLMDPCVRGGAAPA